MKFACISLKAFVVPKYCQRECTVVVVGFFPAGTDR